MSKDDEELKEQRAAAAKAERDTLNDRLQAAKRSGSLSDLRDIIDAINKSSVLMASDKTDLAIGAIEALAIAEIMETKSHDSFSSLNQPLQLEITDEEQEKRKSAEKIYKAFDTIHKDFLEDQKKENKNLDKALKETASGKGLSEETKKSFKTDLEIEAAALRWKTVELTRNTAVAQQNNSISELVKIKKTQILIASEHAAETSEFHTLNTQLDKRQKFHTDILTDANVKFDETQKHYDEQKNQALKIQQGLEMANEIGDIDVIKHWQDKAEEFKKTYEISVQELLKQQQAKAATAKDSLKKSEQTKPKSSVDPKIAEQEKEAIPKDPTKAVTNDFRKNNTDHGSKQELGNITPSSTPKVILNDHNRGR